MLDIVQEPTERDHPGTADEVAILHPTIQAFLDALAAWQLRKALDQDARDVARSRWGDGAAHDDADWMGGRQEFEEAFRPGTSDPVHAKHWRR
ncbi:hypothetical protein [Methylobacterium sp. D54C]